MAKIDAHQLAGRPRTPHLADPIALALLAGLLFAADRMEPRKPRSGAPTVSHSSWMIAPTTSADLTASPCVTTPTASVAGFSVWPLPNVAAVVDVLRLHTLTTARIGGLYGP